VGNVIGAMSGRRAYHRSGVPEDNPRIGRLRFASGAEFKCVAAVNLNVQVSRADERCFNFQDNGLGNLR
jgi:hypothetical protein